MKAKIIGVRVFKDITSEFVISVPEFELPLLQQANDSDVGDDEGRVSKISEDDGVFEYDSERQMYDAMKAKYGDKVVDAVYGNYGEFAKALKAMNAALSKSKPAKPEA